MSRTARFLTARPARRRLTKAAVVVASVGLLAGCASGGGAAAPENSIAAGQVADYYPSDYQSIIDAAEKEGGTLTIYSNTDEENWAPIFRDFKKKYSFVKTIEANNLDSDEVFQREQSDLTAGRSTADLLVSNATQAFATYAERDNAFTEYKSPELDKLPDFATLLPNVYAMSADPMTIAYNSQLFGEPPTSIKSLAEAVKADPAKFKDKITTRDISGAFGFSVSEAFTAARPDSWSDLETILPLARPESSSGSQGDKIVAGEYLAGFFISGAPSYPIVEKTGGLFQVVLPKDGTVVLPRGIAIAPDAPHVNTAKLFTDFVLSDEGQRAVAEGGLTSYRDSVPKAEGLHRYQDVVEEVGEDQVILAKYSVIPEDTAKAFTDRWDGLLKQ